MMKDTAKTQCLLIGTFDSTQDLESAVERLAGEGFQSSVYDASILPEADDTGNPVSIESNVFGSDEPAIVQKFKSHLADYSLSDEIIEAWATTLTHKGKFVLVEAEPERAEQVMKILYESRASRVSRHD